MKRSLLLLAAVLVTQSASAEFIFQTQFLGRTHNPNPLNAPNDMTLDVDGEGFVWPIPAWMDGPDSTQYFMTEATAGDYGMDWSAFETAMLGGDKTITWTATGFNDSVLLSEVAFFKDQAYFTTFDLDQITITLNNGMSETGNWSIARVRFDGTYATSIPEPAAFVLLLFGLHGLARFHLYRVRLDKPATC